MWRARRRLRAIRATLDFLEGLGKTLHSLSWCRESEELQSVEGEEDTQNAAAKRQKTGDSRASQGSGQTDDQCQESIYQQKLRKPWEPSTWSVPQETTMSKPS